MKQLHTYIYNRDVSENQIEQFPSNIQISSNLKIM